MPRLMQLVLVGAMLLTRAAEAQRVVSVDDTVRIVVTGGRRLTPAVVQQWSSGDLQLIGNAGQVYHVPAASILSVRVKEGRRPATGRGALIGLAIGVTVGMAGGIAATADQSGIVTFGPEVIPVMAALFGGGGALVGAILGSFGRADRWVPGQLPPSGSAGVAHARPRITPVVAGGAESTWKIGVRLR